MPKQCCKETWNRIPDDEPVFILRGKDLLAKKVIGEWLVDAHINGVNEDKMKRAREHYDDIERFQTEHPDRCKIPD